MSALNPTTSFPTCGAVAASYVNDDWSIDKQQGRHPHIFLAWGRVEITAQRSDETHVYSGGTSEPTYYFAGTGFDARLKVYAEPIFLRVGKPKPRNAASRVILERLQSCGQLWIGDTPWG
jgi:hypothetical protein